MKDRLRGWLAWLRRVAPERLLLVALVLVAVGAWWWALAALPRPLEVTALAVGDGDCLLIRGPSGRCVLIDGGSRAAAQVGERVLVPNLRLLGVSRLDAILITHSDSDHVNGLADILNAIPVGMVLHPERPSEDADYQRVLMTARGKEIPCLTLRAGDQLHLGQGCQLRVLAPGPVPIAGTRSDDNNNSIVAVLEYRQARMLFTGDLETEGEAAVIAAGGDLHADVVKIPHHGSRHGSTDAFLDAVKPQRALISASGAPEHPHEEVLARLRARGVEILRTDVLGQITLSTRGQGWTLRTYRR